VTPVCDPRANALAVPVRIDASAIGIVCKPSAPGCASTPGTFKTETVNSIRQDDPGFGSTTGAPPTETKWLLP
jgi:hypothetical protein